MQVISFPAGFLSLSERFYPFLFSRTKRVLLLL
nr:MAG TPA: hypothetical protein [Caudoviricetes sp.]